MNVSMCRDEYEARAAIKSFSLASERLEQPNKWETWGFGLAMVTATAFAAALAIMCTPFMSKRVYNTLLTFLLALGVGNLTGCTFFVLFPRAFHISELGSSDYIIKSWMALGGCYLLFVFEKLMDFFGEVKKKRKVKSAQISLVELQNSATETEPATKVANGLESSAKCTCEKPQISSTPHAPVIMAHNNHHIVPHSPRLHHGMHLHQPSSEPIDEKAVENELQSEALLALLGGWANNFIDGMTIGVSFSDSPIRGLTIGIAILSQQFPNEVDSLVIVMKSGVGLKHAMLLNLVQAALSYIGFVIAVSIDNQIEQFNTFIYSVAAGNYLYICLGCLAPEMSDKVVESVKNGVKEGLVTTILLFVGIIIGLLFMFFMALIGKDISMDKKTEL